MIRERESSQLSNPFLREGPCPFLPSIFLFHFLFSFLSKKIIGLNETERPQKENRAMLFLNLIQYMQNNNR